MGLNEYLEQEETSLVRVDEGQLILAKQLQQQLIDFETKRKEIEAKEKEMKKQLEEVMQKNGITRYESNDKRILISLGEGTPDEEQEIVEVDEEKFIHENLKLHNEYVLMTQQYNKEREKYGVKKKVIVKGRKGTLRITIREEKEDGSN